MPPTRVPMHRIRLAGGYKGRGPAWYELAGPHSFLRVDRGVLVDLRQDARLHVVLREGHPYGGPRQVGDAGLVETEQVGGDLVLAVERGVEHRRIVGVHGDRHARVAEGADRV